MLQYLRIQNLALVEEAALEFRPGFTCVTGETGAGKSVLLGALGLLAGARAEKTMIRQGAETCVLEAGLYFGASGRIDGVLGGLGLPPCEEGALLLRRTLSQSRMPVIQVNGATTTLANLRTLGEQWIDFHGPGEPQKLFSERVQLELLDAYAEGLPGGAEAVARRVAYGASWTRRRDLLAERESLARGGRLSEAEQDYLKGQLARMEGLELNGEAIEELEQDFHRAQHAQEWAELAGRLREALGGEGGVTDRLAEALRAAREWRELDGSMGNLADRVEALAVEADDLARECRGRAEAPDLDPATVEALNRRMNAWLELRRRHGGTLETVLAARDSFRQRLASQGNVEGRMEEIGAELERLEGTLEREATVWRTVREAAAGKLAEEVTRLLGRLGFRRARFAIEVSRAGEWTETGATVCSFRFAPNAGQGLLPLNKIASSGETARVMLALKTVLAGLDATPVLVFDEVDANVGGEIGQEVGREMRRLGGRHQVLCVTHLPQVAALGHQHWVVEKRQEAEESTRIVLRVLEGVEAAREEEIARMLGDRKAKSARDHAAELLRGAERSGDAGPGAGRGGEPRGK